MKKNEIIEMIEDATKSDNTVEKSLEKKDEKL